MATQAPPTAPVGSLPSVPGSAPPTQAPAGAPVASPGHAATGAPGSAAPPTGTGVPSVAPGATAPVAGPPKGPVDLKTIKYGTLQLVSYSIDANMSQPFPSLRRCFFYNGHYRMCGLPIFFRCSYGPNVQV